MREEVLSQILMLKHSSAKGASREMLRTGNFVASRVASGSPFEYEQEQVPGAPGSELTGNFVVLVTRSY